MTRRCFFVNEIDSDAQTVNLPTQTSHHLENVLRLRAGDAIEIRDGLGHAWAGEIAGIKKGNVSVRLLGERDCSGVESPLRISLALGLARSDIMDLVVRQATEMGVSRLLAFRAARSQYGLTGSQAEKKKERWSKIAREAMCQCGRTRMPEIAVFEDLDRFVSSISQESEPGPHLKIFAREGESDRGLEMLRQSWPQCAGVVSAIGPEGGWESSEAARLEEAGFLPVHLGPRVLRYETAAIALISSIQLLWGDMGETKDKRGRRG